MYEVAPVEAVQLSETEALPAVAVSPVGAEGRLLAPEELELLLDELDEDELEEELLLDDELDEEDELDDELLEDEELLDEELELELEDELDDDEPPEPIWTMALVLVMVLTYANARLL